VIDGELHVGPYNVQLQSGDAAQLGSLTDIDSGLLLANLDIALGSGDLMTGVGTLSCSSLNNGGTISPGHSAAGQLRVLGNYANLSGGSLNLDLGDHFTGECDLLQVTESATFDGTLVIQALPDFAAAVGMPTRSRPMPRTPGPLPMSPCRASRGDAVQRGV